MGPIDFNLTPIIVTLVAVGVALGWGISELVDWLAAHITITWN